MDFYFSPLACSMATRIALAEAGGTANMIEIDPANKKVLATGEDYFAVNPLGLVPALRTDDGEVLTENAAILQFIADRFPAAALAPPASDAIGRARLQQWLCFIGTELHKGLMTPLLDRKAPGGREGLCLSQICLAARLSERASVGPRIPARPLFRRRRLSRDRARLDAGDAADRSFPISRGEGLSRPHARPPERRRRARRRNPAVPRRNRAAEGGVAGQGGGASVRWQCSGRPRNCSRAR